MDMTAKLRMLRVMLEDDEVTDTTLSAYLDFCKKEILTFLYHQVGGIPASVTDVPQEYEMTQIMGVIAGYNIRGGENQSVSVENGIHRHWHFTDMVEYVRGHVIPYARVV